MSFLAKVGHLRAHPIFMHVQFSIYTLQGWTNGCE